MPSVRIQTTQNVVVEYEIASVGDRVLATIIDWAVYLAYYTALMTLISQLNLGGFWTRGWHVVLLLAPVWLYTVVCEIVFDGRTLGKHARSIRVVKRSGAAAGAGDYILRWLLSPIDMLPFGGIGLLSMVVSVHGQRLGDHAAGTVVVKAGSVARLRSYAFAETDPDGDYQPTYPQAARLTDHDVVILRRVLSEGVRRNNHSLLLDAAHRACQLVGITGTINYTAEHFLRTLLRDHAYLAEQEEVGRWR